MEEISAYCTVNHRASASNYQLSNMKRPAQDSNQRPQRLEARTLTTTPPSSLHIDLQQQNSEYMYFFMPNTAYSMSAVFKNPLKILNPDSDKDHHQNLTICSLCHCRRYPNFSNYFANKEPNTHYRLHPGWKYYDLLEW